MKLWGGTPSRTGGGGRSSDPDPSEMGPEVFGKADPPSCFSYFPSLNPLCFYFLLSSFKLFSIMFLLIALFVICNGKGTPLGGLTQGFTRF